MLNFTEFHDSKDRELKCISYHIVEIKENNLKIVKKSFSFLVEIDKDFN